MPVLSNLIVRIGASTDDFDKKVNASLGKIKRFGATISEAGQALAIGFSAPVLAAGSAALMAATQMESLEKGLAATMKSTAAAATELERLKEVSKLPGLGLKEAVQGSIRLQTLGSSADESRRIMRELGNALAVVGGGKEDFSEVIRQLSQMAAVGKVTKENLDPIVERIPQIAAIIKDKFGAAALGDPAKTFEKMGISAQQFIGVIVSELEKGGRAGGDLKTSMENLRESVEQTAAEFGKSLLPIGKEVVDTILNPMVERAKAAADAFNRLSPETRKLTVEIGAFAAALPIVLVALGTLIEKAGAVGGAITKAVGALKNLGVTAQVLGKAGLFTAIASGIYSLLDPLLRTETALQNQAKAAADNRKFLDTMSEQLVKTGQLVPATDGAYESILNFGRGLKSTDEAAKALTPTLGEAAQMVQLYGKGIVKTYAEEFNSAVIKERLNLLQSTYNQQLSDGVAALVKYGSAAGAAAAALREFRILEMPPSIGGPEADVRKLPVPNVPGLPSEAVLSGAESARSAKRNADMIRIMAGNVGKDWKKTQEAISKQVSTIVTDLSRGIADIIISGGKIGDVFERLGKQIASSLIRTVIENGINRVIEALTGRGGLTGALGSVGKVLGGVFGGGAAGVANSAVPAVSGVAMATLGTIPQTAGAVGSASSGIGSALAAANPVTAMVNAVSGVVSAVSAVISNFQFAAMNKTLDLIEKEVRYSQIHLLHLLEKNNEYLPKLKDIHDSMIRTEGRQMAMPSTGNVTINISTTGDTRALLDALTRELKQLGVVPA